MFYQLIGGTPGEHRTCFTNSQVVLPGNAARVLPTHRWYSRGMPHVFYQLTGGTPGECRMCFTNSQVVPPGNTARVLSTHRWYSRGIPHVFYQLIGGTPGEHRTCFTNSQVVLSRNPARGSVLGHVAVLKVYLGLANQVVLADDVIVQHADGQVLLLGQGTAELHEAENGSTRIRNARHQTSKQNHCLLA